MRVRNHPPIPVALRTAPSASRNLCRASTRFAKAARRTWTPAANTTPSAERVRSRRSVFARLLGRR
ncbi:MAG: hypothetical protein ACM30I_08200 [Gemmatimonas sp.]